MKILVTGTSNGIGLATAKRFLNAGHEVIGFDLNEAKINDKNYTHYTLDIIDKEALPEIDGINVLVNNAGLQNSEDDIQNNLIGTMNVTEKYGFDRNVKAILFNASASAHTGFEFTKYSVSKAGIIGYMKNVAWRVAKNGTICLSISCGGVLTESNKTVIEDKKLWNEIMKVTPLKKWASEEEIAEWIYFLTVINKSATGIDIVIDNGEMNCNCTFVWDGFKGNN